MQAGEDVRIIDRSELPTPALPVDHDFWLIDDRYAVRMDYDAHGRFLGAETVSESDLSRYLIARDLAVRASEPFAGWWIRHPEEWRSNRAA